MELKHSIKWHKNGIESMRDYLNVLLQDKEKIEVAIMIAIKEIDLRKKQINRAIKEGLGEFDHEKFKIKDEDERG